MDNVPHHEFLAPVNAIARDAGRLIMTYFSGIFDTNRKADDSPVTDADIATNILIVKALNAITPGIPVIAEEDKSPGREDHAVFWLVDPLDGTRSFVRGEAEFTVNIGLIRNRKPVFGVIYGPPEDELYYGGEGMGAFRLQGDGKPKAIEARTASSEGLVIMRSRSAPSKKAAAYLETLNIKEMIPCSSAIKFCRLAEGAADIYPRFGRTMEWDSAAGHAILNAAGGRIETVDGKPLTYGKPGFENPPFIAYGK